jgi:hypothetical protein
LLTLLFQGFDAGTYRCPYKCAHCGGSVETEEKLQAHIKKSHITEQSLYHTKLLSTSSSVNCETETILPSLELMKPTKLKSQVDKESSHLQDSFIITMNASDGNESDNKHINLVSVDNIKVEGGETIDYSSGDGVQNVRPSNSGQSQPYITSCPVTKVKIYPVNEKLLVEQVVPRKEQTVAKEASEPREERKVSEVEGMKEKCCRNKEDSDKIAIKHVEDSMSCKTVAAKEKPDMPVQCVKSGLCSVMSDIDMDYSGKASNVNICSVDNVSEIDLNQHAYSKSQLSSSVPSASRQSNDTDAGTDILVKDVYSTTYSDDSYSGRLCQQGNTETDRDTSAKWLDSGAVKRQVLKTYSKRMVRLHPNAFSGPVQLNRPTSEVIGMKKEEPDATSTEPNE